MKVLDIMSNRDVNLITLTVFINGGYQIILNTTVLYKYSFIYYYE